MVCENLLEGIMRKISVILLLFRPVVQEKLLFKIFPIYSSGNPFVRWPEPFV